MAITTADTFGSLLRRFRLTAGLTQEELAERAGLSTRGVQDLERGVRLVPRAETVRMLADALELDEVARRTLTAAAHPELAAAPDAACAVPTAAPAHTARRSRAGSRRRVRAPASPRRRGGGTAPDPHRSRWRGQDPAGPGGGRRAGDGVCRRGDVG